MADSIAYKYDEAGHLIATLDAKTNQPTRKFIYDGDNLIALIDYANGKTDTLKNPITIRDGEIPFSLIIHGQTRRGVSIPFR